MCGCGILLKSVKWKGFLQELSAQGNLMMVVLTLAKEDGKDEKLWLHYSVGQIFHQIKGN